MRTSHGIDVEERTEGGVTTFTLKPGRRVICDDCGNEWTDREESGGLLFQSKAICPACAQKWRDSAAIFGEEHLIRAECPAGKSFANWVREDLR